jgi:hypothetical protein
MREPPSVVWRPASSYVNVATVAAPAASQDVPALTMLVS